MDIPYEEKESFSSEEERYSAREKQVVEVSIYAGFWLRFWAYLIDIIVVGALNGLFITPIFMFMDADPSLFGILAVHSILTSIFAYVYFALMTKFLGQTLGKMVLGLRVQKSGEAPLSWSDVFFREVVGRIFHRTLVITNLLYIVVGVHPEKAGVHDMVADTRVILDRKNKAAE